jgi:hypothetical protein
VRCYTAMHKQKYYYIVSLVGGPTMAGADAEATVTYYAQNFYVLCTFGCVRVQKGPIKAVRLDATLISLFMRWPCGKQI